MKVSSSEIEGSQVVLEMEIEAERLDKAMERAYRRLADRVNVPGFRRGKAPRAIIERVVGRETLMNEALDILVPEAYREAVEQTGIDPVDTPKLDVVSAEPLSVKATVPVRPKVKLGDYRSIQQTLSVPQVTEEQVDKALESVQESRAGWAPVEREAQPGNMATVDLVGRHEDQTFVNSQGVKLTLTPGRVIIAPGVTEELLGMKPGDRKAFDVTLPDDFSKSEFAGKPAVIEASMVEVKEKQLPALDDEFARSVAGEYETIADLRSAVRKELEARARAEATRSLEESVLSAVVEQSEAEPPPTWVEQQADALRKETQERLSREGLSMDQLLRISSQSEESFGEEMREAARRQLKRALVLEAVADAEGVEVTDEELEAAVAQAAAANQGRMDVPGRERLRRNLKSAIRERKTVERLLEITRGAGGAAQATAPAEPQTEAEASQGESEPEAAPAKETRPRGRARQGKKE